MVRIKTLPLTTGATGARIPESVEAAVRRRNEFPAALRAVMVPDVATSVPRGIASSVARTCRNFGRRPEYAISPHFD